MIRKIESVLHSVGSFIKSQLTKLQEDTEKVQQYRLQQQAMQEKQLLDSCILEMMDRMALDLYEAFCSHDYGLATVRVANSIRVQDYRITGNRILYIFSIDKLTDEKIPACKLQNICQRMNKDIASAYRSLCYAREPDMLIYNHPFLTTGIWVSNIQDFGYYQVFLTIETKITPAIYSQNYRQIPPYSMV